jgi:hypothetical protein
MLIDMHIRMDPQTATVTDHPGAALANSILSTLTSLLMSSYTYTVACAYPQKYSQASEWKLFANQLPDTFQARGHEST